MRRAHGEGKNCRGVSPFAVLAAAAAFCCVPACVAAEAADSTAGETVAQRDVIDLIQEWFFDKRVEPQLEGTFSSGLAWSILPTLNYNPVYGFAFGASVSGAGTLGSGPNARPSALSISGNYSTQGQVQAQFKGDVFTPSGGYLIKADIRYLDTERSTWGLGPIHENQQEYPMEFKLSRWYATLYRRTSGPVYVGLGYHYDDYAEIVDERAVLGESTPFTEYTGSAVTRTRASGVSLNLLGDTRDNIVNPSRGYYLSGAFRDYLKNLGSDENWQEWWTEVRLYAKLPQSSPNVLAFWIYSWFTFGSAPYLDLPAVGWDTYGRGGRGYLQGRSRGLNQIYLEAEYRLQLTRDGLLGAVGFLNLMATTDPESQVFGRADHGGGVGLRIKFNKRSNTNLTIDHGWGEAGSRGWFMGMTEVF